MGFTGLVLIYVPTFSLPNPRTDSIFEKQDKSILQKKPKHFRCCRLLQINRFTLESYHQVRTINSSVRNNDTDITITLIIDQSFRRSAPTLPNPPSPTRTVLHPPERQPVVHLKLRVISIAVSFVVGLKVLRLIIIIAGKKNRGRCKLSNGPIRALAQKAKPVGEGSPQSAYLAPI